MQVAHNIIIITDKATVNFYVPEGRITSNNLINLIKNSFGSAVGKNNVFVEESTKDQEESRRLKYER